MFVAFWHKGWAEKCFCCAENCLCCEEKCLCCEENCVCFKEKCVRFKEKCVRFKENCVCFKENCVCFKEKCFRCAAKSVCFGKQQCLTTVKWHLSAEDNILAAIWPGVTEVYTRRAPSHVLLGRGHDPEIDPARFSGQMAKSRPEQGR